MTDEEVFYQIFCALNFNQIDDVIKGASFPLKYILKDFDGKHHFPIEFIKWLDFDNENGFAHLKDCYKVKFALYIDSLGEGEVQI